MHLNIRVTGEVQGVFYRASAKAKAEELSLTGFVKNELDGTVYIEAEGAPTDLQLFMAWCRNGPSGAHVENIESEEAALKHFPRFEIHHW